MSINPSIQTLLQAPITHSLGIVKAARESLGFSYRHGFSGFSARLTEEQAAKLSGLPNVLSVFRNEFHTVHTTNSWEFLGLYGSGEKSLFGASEATESSWLWKKSKFGKDVIIGVLDSGEGPTLLAWQRAWTNVGFPRSMARVRKLFGSWHGTNPRKMERNLRNWGAIQRFSLQQETYRCQIPYPRPASSMALNISWRKNFLVCFCISLGTISHGFYCRRPIREKRKLASLRKRHCKKICWRNITNGRAICPSAHTLSAFDMAIHDGVDILSASIGGLGDYFQHALSMGSFHPMQKGIVVVASAGNAQQTLGPGLVQNGAPWVITVGASTLDRAYFGDLYLGNNKSFRGFSMTEQRLKKRWYHLAAGADVGLPTSNFSARHELVFGSQESPGKDCGMLERANASRIPIIRIHVDEEVGTSHLFIYRIYKRSYSGYTASDNIEKSKACSFHGTISSSGPNRIDFRLKQTFSRPDITAPGVLAAKTQFNNSQISYKFDSGTSMCCPHVTGIVALLKSYRPAWSPEAIKSAIVTTGYSFDNLGEPIKNSSRAPASPFYYGGHVNPNAAAHPGLVYDADEQDYIGYLCSLGYNQTELQILTQTSPKPDNPTDLNYPSIATSDLHRSKVVQRRVTNVDDDATNYTASIEAPESGSVSVHPSVLQFKRKGETEAFQVIFRVEDDSNIDRATESIRSLAPLQSS
ncbi:hypothetical protein SELMODRAFT_417801 [Selaginella moellendorffii]|uniref:Uncharacterized protein AIR3L8-2 n=1 Tax=Selaginella moellendorffii TaxID=88036 RepID=D8S3N5_SELML|nr:hypothetical protein SELMODRAFT_417801 [Selaginella moellendorffii]